MLAANVVCTTINNIHIIKKNLFILFHVLKLLKDIT